MIEQDWIRNSLTVARTGQHELHVLTTVYPEHDALNPGGQLLLYSTLGQETTRSVLSTSRPLAAMWRSPARQLWLGSSDGQVLTTHATGWQNGELDAVTDKRRWTWSAANLKGDATNITAIWGSSESNVFFATAAGTIHRWDGRNWTMQRPSGASLTKMHGVASNHAYAVGYSATIVHWNGERWRRLKTPALDPSVTIITGVAVQRSGKAYAVTNRGHVLARNGDSFVVVARTKASFTGLVAWKGVLAISSSAGAWLYSDIGGARVVKDNFTATDVVVVGNELHFIESDQLSGPAVIEFQAKRQANAWQRLVF